MINIVKDILQRNEHAVLATVTPGGAPWAVPVHIAFDDKDLYWVSDAQTVHSINIRNDGRVSVVAFESDQRNTVPGEKGAVYIATTARELHGDEAVVARAIYYDRFPHKNNDKFNSWSIYSAPMGEINEAKSHDQMIYLMNKDSAA